MSNEWIETDSGIELTFAVNHLGYFITTRLLLEMLRESPSSRIIVVASDLHQQGKIVPNNLMHKDDYHGFSAYCDSKLANILFTYKMADALKGSNTTINAVHPGVIKTKFGVEDRNSDMTFPMGRLSPEDGAKAQIYVTTHPQVPQPPPPTPSESPRGGCTLYSPSSVNSWISGNKPVRKSSPGNTLILSA